MAKSKVTAAEYASKARRDWRSTPATLNALRKLYRTIPKSEASKRAHVAAALNDKRVATKLRDELAATWGKYAAAQGDGKIIDFIKWLLEWVLEHADEIIALIVKIIPLFVV